MSYPPSNGSVPDYNVPNGYNYPPPLHQQNLGQQPQYHPNLYQTNSQPTYNQNVNQPWQQNNVQSQYHMNQYSTGAHVYQHPPPNLPRQQIQEIQRSQFVPSPPSHAVQQIPQINPTPSTMTFSDPTSINPVYLNPAMITAPTPTNPEHDKSKLLVSLAEEYFAAAHQLAPKIVLSMNEAEMDQYEELIAAGLGCLAVALRRVKMQPRMEAKIRLRYAGVLFEETENHVEAETTLSQGIALCERNRYFDLKYAMQFLLAQFIARKTPKAAIRALDTHAGEAQTYQHFSWVYAFRFLRASYSFQFGGHVDVHAAVQNLRSIASLASEQHDYAVHMAASLWEAMIHMKSTAPDAVQNVQTALGLAWTNQLNAGNIKQLLGIAHFLQVGSSIRQSVPTDMHQQLKNMQMMMDSTLREESWSTVEDSIALPINRTARSSVTVSSDTRGILGIGEDGRDILMLSFMSARDAFAMTYLLCGMVNFQRNSQDSKAQAFFDEGLTLLEGETNRSGSMPSTLNHILDQNRWRGEAIAYLRAYSAFLTAILGQWTASKVHVDKLEAVTKRWQIPLDGSLGLLFHYLTGVRLQGTGKFEGALRVYESKEFDLSRLRPASTNLDETMQRDLCILAALNRLLILQVEGRQNANTNITLLNSLEPLCKSSPSKEIQTAYHLLLAAIKTNPEAQIFEVKKNLKAALNGAQLTANQQFTCMTLNVMCDKFFRDVVGPQAEKSAKAAAATAHKVGNPLWRSVAEGMVGKCYMVQGKLAEGQENLQLAKRLAVQALPKS